MTRPDKIREEYHAENAPDHAEWDAAIEAAAKVAAGEVAALGRSELAPFMRRAIRALKKGPAK